MKYITVAGEDITGVYDDANGNVPQGAIPIGETIYEMFKTTKYGFGEFLYRDKGVIKRDGLEEMLPPLMKNPLA
jgi:hypothetical protein